MESLQNGLQPHSQGTPLRAFSQASWQRRRKPILTPGVNGLLATPAAQLAVNYREGHMFDRSD